MAQMDFAKQVTGRSKGSKPYKQIKTFLSPYWGIDFKRSKTVFPVEIKAALKSTC